MKITAITIENFKGISETVRVELKSITLLFGANSVGKSTIVQALHYVREILERNNVDADRCLGADESLDLGGFRNLVHNHDLSNRIRFKIEMTTRDMELPEYTTLSGEGPTHRTEISSCLSSFVELSSFWLELEIAWSESVNKPYVSSYAIGFHDAPFAQITCKDAGGKTKLILDLLHPKLRDVSGFCDRGDILLDLHHKIILEENSATPFSSEYLLDGLETAVPRWGRALKLSASHYEKAARYADKMDIESSNDIDQNRSVHYANIGEFEGYISQLIVGPGELLLEELTKVRYIGPIRKVTPREYTPLRYNDESRWASGLAAWDLLYKADPSLVAKTSDWLSHKDRLDSGYSLKMLRYKKIDMAAELYHSLTATGVKREADLGHQIEQLPEEKQLLLIDERRNIDVRPQDIGIGISQILPVVVGALDVGTGILMVEQPELHIHPRLQTSLGDLFISQAQADGKTFIIETHSEHLLLRLLRRIRETSDGDLPEGIDGLTPEQVSVNYVELTEDGLRIRTMTISPDGDFNNKWPNGFFTERAKELF